MASTKFLEEDLRTDVDEYTVSAIVGGSLDTNLVTATPNEVNTSHQQHQHHYHLQKFQSHKPQEQLSNFQLNYDNNNLLLNTNNSNQDNNSSSNSNSAIVLSNGHINVNSCDSNSVLSNFTTTTTTTTIATNTNNNNDNNTNNNNENNLQKCNFDELNNSNNAKGVSDCPQLANFDPSNAIATTDDTIAIQPLQQDKQQQSQQTTANLNSPVVVNPAYSSIQTFPELTRSSVTNETANDVVNSTRQILTKPPPSLSSSSTVQPAMSKNNEPVKLVYPSKIQNGTINLATLSSQQQQPNIMHTSTSMATNTGTNTVTGQQQPQTIVIKNQATNQNIVANSMMPGVQLVNMRSNTPAAQTKTVATVSPRVVISPHMVATRPQNPGITLSALQQGPGTGSALLLKTENGQYRLLHVGPQTTQQTLPNTGANSTIRIQTVPSVSRFTGPPLALRKTIVTQQPVKAKQSPTINTTTRSRESLTANQLPPVASVAPVTHAIAQQANLQPQPHIQTQQVNVSNVPASVNVTSSASPAQMQQQQTNFHNTKEKCRKFLSNLLELSSREPKPVEQNVQELIQELIDANVEPDEFCNRLERLLNASPQPCLIGFLKKSLPLLRQSLCLKELTIEGIKPPPHSVAFASYSTSVAPSIRPVVPTLTSIGMTQLRMVPQITTRPTILPPTSIARHQAPVRIQGPRIINPTQIRAPSGAIIQQHPTNVQIQSHPPALHPVSQNTFAPGGAHIRATNVPVARSAPSTVQIRHTASENGSQMVHQTGPKTKKAQQSTPTIKVGSTQIKPIINTSTITSAPQPVILSQQPIIVPTDLKDSMKSTIKDSTKEIMQPTPLITASTTIGGTISNAGNTPAVLPPRMVAIKSQSSAANKANATGTVKERKTTASFFQQSSMSSSMYGDDDINDVAAMGGVNLAEESQRILGSTELIGRQIRSCKDEVFLHLSALQMKIRSIVAKHGLEEPNSEVAVLISHACQERLKNIVEKLAVIAEHRIDIIKIDPRYEITKDVRGQIKFLEELDKAEQKRHEEQEREMLMRAAKSRSKTEDPEQAKLKAKAKEMQRAEMEELRQRDANLTALQAIGPRKKPKLENDTATATTAGGSNIGISGTPSVPLRPRIKRVNLRDMIFYLEQERDTCRSTMLYKSYLK